MTGKKLDPFWEHTKKIGDKDFLCKFCEHHFRGGVSIARFKSHLAGETRRDTKICDKVPEDVQSAAFQAIYASTRKKTQSPVSLNNDTEENSEPGKSKECAIISHPSSSMVKGTHQSTTMPRKICKEDEKCLVDRKLAKFILSNGLSGDVIQSPSFIDFAKSLAEFGPGYEVASPERFVIDSIEYWEMDVDKYVAEVKRPLAETGCTLILDEWDDCDEDDIDHNVNIFIYTPKGLILEESCKQLSSEIVVASMLDNLGSRHVIQFFGGKGFYPQISTCASLVIELFFGYLSKVEWIQKTFRFAGSLVKYFKRYDRVYYQMSTGYYESDDLNYCASSFLVLQAVLKDENELKELHPPVASDSNEDFSSIIGCSEFWRDGKELVQVLQPIFQLLNLVNGYMSTSGYLYEAFQRAKTKIEKCSIQNQDNRYKLILEKFEECRMKTIQPIHMAAALLNPDYKFSENLKDNEIKEGISYILEKLADLEEKEALRTQIESYCTMLRPAFRDMKIDVHPRIWWERYDCDAFLVLRKYAIQILSQPCGMLSCHRYRLKHTCCITDYELGVNTRLMEKYYSMLEAGDEEPIDLDKLSGSPEYEYAEKYMM